VLSSLGLTLVRRRGYVVPWLAVLAGTWALVWLVWNFAPQVASLSIGLLLLALNILAACGAWRTILGHRASPALRQHTPSSRCRRRRAIGIIDGVAGIALMSGVLAAPAAARVVVAAPHGTVRTIAIAAPVEVDDATLSHIARPWTPSYAWPAIRVFWASRITCSTWGGKHERKARPARHPRQPDQF
jgi:hypothetical protein